MNKKADKNAVTKKNIIVEKLIEKPYLMNNRKFNFKYYLVIVSSSPLIVLYRQAYLEVCIKEYTLKHSNGIN